MPTNTLTDRICKATMPGEKPRKLFDGHGLYLFITPAGGKLWRVAYRQGGKPQTATLGPYPVLSLADARIKRDELRRKLLDGPIAKPVPITRALTLSQAIEQYWAGRKDVSPSYLANVTRGLAMHVEPSLGGMAIKDVTRDDLLVALKVLDAAGKHVYVRRIRVWVSQVFDWSVEHGHTATNPASFIKPEKAFGKSPVVSHAALKLADVPAFMQRLALEGELQSVLACRLLALTWVRTGELRRMVWSELEGDVWRVPGPRMKMKREHLVPLSAEAMAILEQLKARSRGGEYVFPSEHRIDRPMSENAVLYLIHRMGFKDKMTGHGWRGVASTWANENGYPPDAIERQLAHAPKDAVRSAYNHAAYMPQRRAMLEDWAKWLLCNT